MTPLQQTRLEKAAADCGFELPPVLSDGALVLRSTRFPESVTVRMIPLAAAGLITPWMAALGMTASSLIVVCNSLRLTPRRKKSMPAPMPVTAPIAVAAA